MTPPSHGIQRHPLKYVCLAGNIREYYDWIRKHDLKEGETMYVSTPTLLLRTEFPPGVTFHQIGTFEHRKDALRILDEVRQKYPTTTIYFDR